MFWKDHQLNVGFAENYDGVVSESDNELGAKNKEIEGSNDLGGSKYL